MATGTQSDEVVACHKSEEQGKLLWFDGSISGWIHLLVQLAIASDPEWFLRLFGSAWRMMMVAVWIINFKRSAGFRISGRLTFSELWRWVRVTSTKFPMRMHPSLPSIRFFFLVDKPTLDAVPVASAPPNDPIPHKLRPTAHSKVERRGHLLGKQKLRR